MELEAKDITSGEEKELRRVFDKLAAYYPKSKIRKVLDPLLERKTKIENHRKLPDTIKVTDQQGNIMTEADIDAEYNELQDECSIHEKQLAEFDSNPSKKIKQQDLMEALRALGSKKSKKEVEDVIWEVDENLDSMVDWEEFRLMFQRNVTDKTGLEPFQLFNVVQFMMYDKDGSGKVTVDETMHMLYARYGKDRLESQMKALFGEDLKTSDGDGELSFEEYLKAVSVRMPRSQMEKSGHKKGR